MWNHDLIAAIEYRSDMDHWSNSISEFRESQHGEGKGTMQQEFRNCNMRNRDLIWAVRLRLNLDCWFQLHIGVSRIATWRGKRNNATRIAKSRFNRSHWIKVCSGPSISVHFGVSRIESWRCQRTITKGILKSRYAILRFNRSRQIKMWSGPSIWLTSTYHIS